MTRSPLPWPFERLDARHADLLLDAADHPWDGAQPRHARAWCEDGWIHLRRGRARLRLLASAPLSSLEEAVRAAVGSDARRLWPALAEQVLCAEGGRLFLHGALPATMTYGAAVVDIVSGRADRWRQTRLALRLPDVHRPRSLLPPPEWIPVGDLSPFTTAHQRTAHQSILARHGLAPLSENGR